MYIFIIGENTEFELKVSGNKNLIFPVQIHTCFVKNLCYKEGKKARVESLGILVFKGWVEVM